MNPVDATAGVLSGLKSWVTTPLKTPLAPMGLFLLTGLVIVFAVAWTMIIHELEITL